MATKTTKKTDIKKPVEKLFSLLSIDGDVSVTKTDDAIEVILDTDNNGLIIGRHGEVLEALQLILALCIANVTGEYMRVSLEVGDYRKNRTDYLTKLAEDTKRRVSESGQEQPLSDLKPWERRIVHMLLQDDDQVFSESVGEGRERTLVVKPRE